MNTKFLLNIFLGFIPFPKWRKYLRKKLLPSQNIIMVIGFGRSGNSAVRDFLKEFSSCHVTNLEDCIFKYSGGLLDLRAILLNNPNYFTADAAIKEYLNFCWHYRNYYRDYYHGKFIRETIKFIQSITVKKYKVANIPFNWHKGLTSPINPKKVYVAKRMNAKKLDKYIRKYVRNLLAATSDKKNIVLVNSWQNGNLKECIPLLNNVKIITCRRDLRDVYCDFKYNTSETFIPTDSFNNTKLFFDSVYHQYPVHHKKILNISFEDMVLNYDKTSSIIMKFCGLKSKHHIFPLQFFNPVFSAFNIQIWKRNPQDSKLIKQLHSYQKNVLNISSNIKHITSDVLFCNYKRTSNIGDIKSSPFNYFKLSNQQKQIDIKQQLAACGKSKVLILGGGIYGSLKDKLCNTLTSSLNIAWGIGIFNEENISQQFRNNFQLIGIREYNHPAIDNKHIFYVPCSSCMNPAFDKKFNIKHKVVFYAHKQKTTPEQWLAFNELPVLTNEDKFSKVIKFLGEAETVITNSYHGVYWATLLGKKVLCLPFNSKFYNFKYPPQFTSTKNWNADIHKAQTHPEYLTECRNINYAFYNKTQELILQNKGSIK